MLAADGESQDWAGQVLTPLCEGCGAEGGPGVVESDSAVRRRLRLEQAQELHRELNSIPNCSFDSLVVRPLEEGYCLQGTLVFDQAPPDLTPLVAVEIAVQQRENEIGIDPMAFHFGRCRRVGANVDEFGKGPVPVMSYRIVRRDTFRQ